MAQSLNLNTSKQSYVIPEDVITDTQRLGVMKGYTHMQSDNQIALQVLYKFQNFNIYPYTKVEEDTLLSALDKMVGDQFDREVARQLFEQCNPDYRNRIQIEDFIRASFDALKILQERIFKSKQEVAERNKELKQIENLILQNDDQQNLNQFGIDNNSHLKIDVIEACDLYHQGNPNELPYVMLKCGGKNHKTTVPFIKDQVNPKWNQQFDFPIFMGSEELYVEILSFDTVQNINYLIGQVVIPVNGLRDQLKSDKWHPIYDVNNILTRGRIRLTLHWIHNKQLYLENMAQSLQSHIDQVQAEIIDYEYDTKVIQSYLNGNPIVYSGQTFQRRETVQNMVANASTPSYLKQTLILSFVLLFCATLQSLNRPPFVDIMIGLFILIGFFINFFERVYFQVVLAILLFSFLSDVVWLGYNFESWWSNQGQQDVYSESAHVVLRFALIFIIFTLGVKIALGIYLYQTLDLFLHMNQHFIFSFGEYQFVIRGQLETVKSAPNENPFFDHINTIGMKQNTTYLKGRLSTTQKNITETRVNNQLVNSQANYQTQPGKF
ncbi:C2 domain protein (macronuclear) [Tetrahymena thermophila SB210]|uniref:C2 domain protein n=1 Tax=Tetrahymena thermophila (strain SB210) TaxID=312017 RepID=W7X4G5_TETTS|nr:C2 domain protein [Tetrahymena thermophila SB210]EWS74220.1 C2 domain protein [Tetrahymena thermophila SB210]|eukprot:XP_012653248.1 C2 domain protein [Tetrahymena thermophila SB210]